MKIVYTPRGRGPLTFDVMIDDLEGPECELIEESGGNQWVTFGEWLELLQRNGYRAAKVFIWALLRRTNPALDFEEMADFRVSELLILSPEGELEEGKAGSGEAVSVPAVEPTSSESPTPDSAA